MKVNRERFSIRYTGRYGFTRLWEQDCLVAVVSKSVTVVF